MRAKVVVRVAAPVLLACALTGCAWTLQKRDRDPNGRCTTSRAFVTADIALAVAGLVDLATAMLMTDAKVGPEGLRTTMAVAGVLEWTLFGASAATGERWARECERPVVGTK